MTKAKHRGLKVLVSFNQSKRGLKKQMRNKRMKINQSRLNYSLANKSNFHNWKKLLAKVLQKLRSWSSSKLRSRFWNTNLSMVINWIQNQTFKTSKSSKFHNLQEINKFRHLVSNQTSWPIICLWMVHNKVARSSNTNLLIKRWVK